MAWTMNHPPRMPSTVGERSAKHYDRINTDPAYAAKWQKIREAQMADRQARDARRKARKTNR